ncbi:MAG: MoaD/ThiS family protein [Acetobacterium sp.]|nr:MoaD/ThiS family protein [Acetobacterium sp.]
MIWVNDYEVALHENMNIASLLAFLGKQPDYFELVNVGQCFFSLNDALIPEYQWNRVMVQNGDIIKIFPFVSGG